MAASVKARSKKGSIIIIIITGCDEGAQNGMRQLDPVHSRTLVMCGKAGC